VSGFSKVKLIAETDKGLQICAAAARLSTTQGTSLEVFARSEGDERNLPLVKKVLASGHKSLIEHQTYSVAFENVSVLAEQFMIEFRLASYIVKSRRYVDFRKAGFYTPEALKGDARYAAHMERLFLDYEKLAALVPKEDARFVLPYSFYSNFFISCNLRTLLSMALSLRYGRGSAFSELRDLGDQLSAQIEARYPGILEPERSRYERTAPFPAQLAVGEQPRPAKARAAILDAPADARALLQKTMAFSGRFPCADYAALLTDARPRELEPLTYTFGIDGASLACITHFARHRMLSPIFQPALTALNAQAYTLPESIRKSPEALAIYESALRDNAREARALADRGVCPEDLSYYALSGLTTSFLMTINARELLHFVKLRACERAQWEIRALTQQMLTALREDFPELFSLYGPSCAIEGACPEGRLTCGRPRKPIRP
jgi:flavin-dependent thymidylate synthase